MPGFTQHAAATLSPVWVAGAVALDVLCVALLMGWSFAISLLMRSVLTVPTAPDGLALPEARDPAETVCMVVPVHNEEGSIGRLVESVRAQDYPHLRVVLCLDRCTDGTAGAARRAVAGDARFSIVEIAQCPDGWAGKVNAVVRGVDCPAARESDLLLFVDADTSLDPACVRASVALLKHRQVDLLSLLTTLTGHAWYERVVQPVAGYELLRQFPLTRVNRRSNPRAFANGQFMLFRREAYEAVGGHAAVHDELLEDMALARRVVASGRFLGLFDARGLLTSRMYDSWPAFREGWKRIYTECARLKPVRLRKAAMTVRMAGTVLPLAGVCNLAVSLALLVQDAPGPALGRWGLALACAGLAACLLMLLVGYRLVRRPLWAALTYPVGAWQVGGILAEAASDLDRGIPTRWAGREYVREAR